MQILSATAGRYGLQPLMEGIATAGTSYAVGAWTPSKWQLGTAMVKSSVRVLGMEISPSWFTGAVTTGGAWIEELVMAQEGDPATWSWERWAYEMAKSDAILYGADFGLILLLQWGRIKNINIINSLISIPTGAVIGKGAYRYVGKPLFVAKGQAQTYKGYSLSNFFGPGQQLGQFNQMLNQATEENLVADLRQEGIIQMSEDGWQT